MAAISPEGVSGPGASDGRIEDLPVSYARPARSPGLLRRMVATAGSAVLLAAAMTFVGSTAPARAAVECRDVFVLALPGTWETNARANPAVVPGMLSKVTNPLKTAVESGKPISAPAVAPTQIGQEQSSSSASGGALNSLVGGLLDTAAQNMESGSGSSSVPTGSVTVPSVRSLTAPAVTTETAAPAANRHGGPRFQLIDDETRTTTESPDDSTEDPSSTSTDESSSESTAASGGSDGGGAIGRSVSFEQVPYVAEVGGPIAGVVHGDPLTLGQSRANGVAALTRRLKAIDDSCPTSKVAILGYSQGALVAGDVLSAIGNGHGPIPDSMVLAGGLLSDPARTPTTANLDSDTASAQQQVIPGSETFVGQNVPGQGAVGARPDGFGTLADRVTSFCAEGDAICSLTGKSKAIQAVVPLLNLRPQDIGPYASGRAKILLTNVATADPNDIEKAATSVITAAMQVSVAGATNPYAIPLELARVVFASSMLDDIGRVVKMPEYDAFLSLVKPDQLATQLVQVASYSLLGVHQAYDRRPVDGQGDTATTFLAKWLLGRIEAD